MELGIGVGYFVSKLGNREEHLEVDLGIKVGYLDVDLGIEVGRKRRTEGLGVVEKIGYSWSRTSSSIL